MIKRIGLVVSGCLTALLISSCGGGGSTTGGVGTTTGGVYYGTVSYTGVNTCGRNIPGSGNIYIVITSAGDAKFDPVGLVWGYPYVGSFNFLSAVNGSKIQSEVKCVNNACTVSGGYLNDGYTYKIDGRVRDNGATVTGTGFIEGSYGSCYEKFEGAFAATKTD
jgi:hypothetical protein